MTRYIAFWKTVEQGSFTRAADILGYTQAAVSQMIRSLEAECGVPLILRLKTGIQLTEAGKVLYPYIINLIESNKRLTEKIQELRYLELGKLRVGAIYGISETVIPQVFVKITDEYPDSKLSLVCKSTNGLEGRLECHDIDIAIVNPDLICNIPCEKIGTEQYFAVMSADHPLAKNDFVSRKELAENTLVLPQKAEDPIPQTNLGEDLKRVYYITDISAIANLAVSGLGIAILPESMTKNISCSAKILPITPAITRNIGVAYHSREWLTPASQKFISIFTENYSKLI